MEIEVQDVRKSYGATVALRGVSFSVAQGKRVGLIGPNGSGKSTLLRILMGLLEYQGQVRLGGHCPLRQRAQVAPGVAYVPQVAPQLQAPVAEVVGAVMQLRGIPLGEVHTEVARLALDLPSLMARPFRALSGGMKQKLLLAMALCALRNGASLLVMDEPTASLDEAARQSLSQLLQEELAGTTLLLCSHRMEEVAPLVEDVVVLAEGAVAYDGPVARYLEGAHG